MSPQTIGIDLGTTYSAVARVEAGRPVVLRNSAGRCTTPSVIYFPGKGQPPVVGEAAKLMLTAGETDVVSFFKRRMGDPHYSVEYHGTSHTARALSAILLRHLLQDTLGATHQRAIITVPAYFDNHRRTETIKAGEEAGIDVIGIVNEPTAAAIAFGLGGDHGRKTALVYDLGGGTFDTTIVRLGRDEVEVVGTDGDHELGGKDWDDRLVRYVAQQFEDEFGDSILEDTGACLDLGARCETAKQQLSAMNKTRVSLSHAGRRGNYEVTRELFEEISRDLVDRTMMLAERALSAVALEWKDIDEIVPVGGSTRMPMITSVLKARYSGRIASGIDPDEAVALGAAWEAERRTSSAMHFGLAGAVRVQDVMAHSLGMVAENPDRTQYINKIIIHKNKTIPSREVCQFQQRVRKGRAGETEVYVLQGESPRPSECTVLGKYVISDIQPENNGVAVLDISYSYDENGVVKVEAVQSSTGATLPVRVELLPERLDWLDGSPAKHGGGEIEHLSIFLAIDLSGSMSGNPLAQAQAAAQKFVRELDLSSTSIGLNIFADHSSITVELSQSAEEINRGISAWKIGAVGGGNNAHPFDDLRLRLAMAKGRRFIVLLTDGVWSSACCREALDAAQSLKEDGVEIVALGFGGAKESFLQKLANSEQGALFTQLEDLGAQMSRIAQVMTDAQSLGAAPAAGGLSFFR